MPCFLFQASQEQRQHPASPPLQSAHGMAKEAGAAQTDIPRGKSQDAGSVGRPVEKRPVPDGRRVCIATFGNTRHTTAFPVKCRRALQVPSQHAASPNAARCVAHRTALRFPPHSRAGQRGLSFGGKSSPVCKQTEAAKQSKRKPFPSQSKAHRSNGHQPKQDSVLRCHNRSVTVRHSFWSFVPTVPAQFSIQDTMLFVENERESTTAPAQFSIQDTMLLIENK